MRLLRLSVFVWCLGAVLAAASLGRSQESSRSLRKVGGFLCVSLHAQKNDRTFDLYEVGYWSHASFAMDIWKRHGVPFWYPRGAGNILVAGPRWAPAGGAFVSSAECGGKAMADHQQPGNGAIQGANDDDLATYWYSGDNRPFGKLSIEFPAAEPVSSIRFLGWATARHAPKDYRVGVILPDGNRREIASVRDEKRTGQWISFDTGGVRARGVYLDVTATVENQHGPVIYELQAKGASPPKVLKKKQPPASEVAIPLAGAAAEEFFVLGNVGAGFDIQAKAGATVGQYVVAYESGQTEVVPLVVGKNLAPMRYGHFVPEAEVAYALPDRHLSDAERATGLYYHLDEMVPVEPKKQLMIFGHRLAYPRQPIKSIALRASDADSALYLAALTLRQSGPRLNALVYNGRMLKPYPDDTPRAPPSPLDAIKDAQSTLSLDGQWLYRTDPGNLGIAGRFFAAEHPFSSWKAMPVPSQWYVQGLDYHGVVWFRREFDVPAAFPEPVWELCFGGVDYDARVWLNGQYLGRHVGAYASFKLDATPALKRGARNALVVRVDSPIDPGFSGQKTLIKGNAMDDIAMPYGEEGCMGGIYRPVLLRGRGEVGIDDAWAESTLSGDLAHADVKVRFSLSPKEPRQEELTIRCRLMEPNGGKTHTAESRRTVGNALRGVPGSGVPASMAIRRNATEGVPYSDRPEIMQGSLAIGIDKPRLWYPWEQGEPFLYTMEIEVWRGPKLLDRHLSRVGIRQVGFDETKHCLYVNHHRVFLKGMLNDDVHWMSLMDRTGYRQRIQMQKDANLNVIRMVTHQSSPEMYDLCNEMGMMVWQEMPLQWSYSASAPVRKDILDVVRETVVECRPYPCVVGYSAWNEGGQGEFSEKLVALMKSLDASRPISRACGGGDWDIHIYPNLGSNLSRMTPLWSGVKVKFVSEVGAYGLPSPEEMHAIVGPNLFPFDSAEYYWETFHSYRYNDGPVFLDAPAAADWPTPRIRDYVLKKAAPSGRWLAQFMKFMFENFRGQRFDPTTAAIHCRFDDPFPTAFLGIVHFTGRPRQAYHAVREACQPVLPILFFDYTGAEDVRVVNEYWHKNWTDCTLQYTLKTRNGTIVKRHERKFDLPADATVKVLTREEAGDVWHLPGFLADLRVVGPDGKVLSENHYDLTADEIRDFVTTVYPVPPVKPVDGILLKNTEAKVLSGTIRQVEVKGTYSGKVLETSSDAGGCAIRYEFTVPHSGEYLVRVACNSGEALTGFDLTIDGKSADRERYPFIQVTQGITRGPYSSRALSWHLGWRVSFSQGPRTLLLRRASGPKAPILVLDAICLQPSRR